MTQLDVRLTPPLPPFNLGSEAARGYKRIDSALVLICVGPD